ncbi:hypothetical protein SteCoe_3208 [Stentor coeruleus]|uniref:Uncharacterized protein n=1 Tax=Stentor coeruleus TaxID=5963 RepID=A0A1R2CXM9_9CILI|nr:hypothetical protein SteCoe_3208 [Stentor coeruleus]
MSQIGLCDFTGCQNKATKKCTCGGRFKLCLNHESVHFVSCKNIIIPYDIQDDINLKYLELLNRTIKRHRKDIITKTQSMIEYIQKCSQTLLFNLKKYAKKGRDQIIENSPENEIKNFLKDIPKLYDNYKLYSRFEIITSMILSFNNQIGFKDIQDYEKEIDELKDKIFKLENDVAKGRGGQMKRSEKTEFEENFFESQPRLESSKNSIVKFENEQSELMDRRPPVARDSGSFRSQIIPESCETGNPTVVKVEIAVRAFKHIILIEKVWWLNYNYRNLMALQEVEDVRLSKDYKYIFVCNH